MTDSRINEALRHIHPSAGFRPWHGGASVLGSLRGVSPEVAAWKPYPDRHSIWELALHIAYWNYAVWRRLTDGDEGGFPRSPSDWPAVPERSGDTAKVERGAPTGDSRGGAEDGSWADAWEEDRRLIREWHDRLVEAIEGFDSDRLADPAGEGSKTSYADLITGVLLHDTYHAGQIQIMKRLAASAGVEA